MSVNETVKLPEVIVFAGPNGSGKTTITQMAKTVGDYMIILQSRFEFSKNVRMYIIDGAMSFGARKI